MPQEPASPIFAHAISNAEDPATASSHIARQIRQSINAPIDLLIVNASGDHAVGAADVAAMLRHETGARHIIGCSAAGVAAGAVELENRTGISVLAAHLPGTVLTPLPPDTLDEIAAASRPGTQWPTDWPTTDQTDPPSEHAAEPQQGEHPAAGLFASLLPASLPHTCTLLLADPFSTPVAGLVAQLGALHAPANARAQSEPAPVLFGGIASGADNPGGNTLILDDEAYYQGAVAIAISGNLRCDIAVSQGCRPIGPNMKVTKAKGNLILRLDDRPALEAFRTVVRNISDNDRRLLSGGLFLGCAIHQQKTHLGRGDYLIRNVIGADEDSGGVAVADIVPENATVRLHFRDATSAKEDLELLLDLQKLHGPPAGAFLVTCNGRGERFFGKQNQDSVTIQRAFLPAKSGSERAKSGEAISPQSEPIPLAGFFAAGEIGPISGQTFLHGYTACLACFRPRTPTNEA